MKLKKKTGESEYAPPAADDADAYMMDITPRQVKAEGLCAMAGDALP